MGISQVQNPTQNSSVVFFQKAEFPGGENAYRNELIEEIESKFGEYKKILSSKKSLKQKLITLLKKVIIKFDKIKFIYNFP